MQTLVQKFLQENNRDFSLLTERFKIKVTPSSIYPELVSLKYNQIESPFEEPLVQECRGMVINKETLKIIAFPYKKFFNYGEALAADIDWDSAKVYSKLDGSLITAYYYKGQWNVATSGTPDAQTEVNGFGKNFSDLFWEVVHNDYGDLEEDLDPKFCYMFELCTPYNQVVCQYPQSFIVLHGCRNMETLQEVDVGIAAQKINVGVPNRLLTKKLEKVLEEAEELNPIEEEGYVVVDKFFNRLKVKCSDYVRLHNLKDTLSLKGICEIVRSGEGAETLAYFPQLQDKYDELLQKHKKLISLIYSTFDSIKEPDQKGFAKVATQFRFSGALFAMKKGVELGQYLAKLQIKSYMELLNEV